MIDKEIKSICISDIHLGNKRNKTKDIIKNLKEFFKPYDYKHSLDFIFLAGDTFDLLLNLSDNDVYEVILWIDDLLNMCARNFIRLRVLEGTPSHEWKQSKLFDIAQAINKTVCDLRYISTLHIEYVNNLDIHILYVPDEWNHSTDKTFLEVKDLMVNENIVQVDLAIMHGQFGYQLPSHLEKIPKHIESNYLSIVKNYILIGHVHISSTCERILAQGSFDRLAHNEEAPKGGMYFTFDKNGNRNFFFIENKNAKIFKTIHCKHKELEKSFKQIDKEVKDIPIDSYIRIKSSKDNPIYLAFDDVKGKYPLLIMSKISTEEEKEMLDSDLISESVINDYVPININKQNILSLVLDGIKVKTNINNKDSENIVKIMNEVI